MPKLKQVVRGIVARPPRIMLYGQPGVGKSTWAANAPAPIFIPCEDGIDGINADKFPLCKSYRDVMECLKELATEQHDYETVAIDTVDWLERMIWDEIVKQCGVTSIERVDGGYGRGYVAALEYWRDLCRSLDRLRNERDMIVILIAHAKVERYEDPEGPAYDRWVPRLNKLAAALLSEWCDAVLFALRRTKSREEQGAFGKRRTIPTTGDDRIVRATGNAACTAKNRYGISAELPLSFDAFLERVVAFQEQQAEKQ